MNKISAIVTYYNEEKNILKTINSLLNQTKKIDEIIFVNSKSNDGTSEIINKFIKKNPNYRIKNISFKTQFPSESINLGIVIASNDLIFLMDCGLQFSKNTLKYSFELLQKKNLDLVFGSAKLQGINPVDVASVSHTYGYNKYNITIPGSLIKKNIFYNNGFFLESRSFYDVIWKKKIFSSKLKYNFNFKYYLKYIGINYADSFFQLFKKSYIYSRDTINVYRNSQTLIYLILFYLLIKVTTINNIFFLIYLFFYIIIRLTILYMKSFNEKILNKTNIFNLIATSIVIDFGRLFGFFSAIFKLTRVNTIFAYSLIMIFIVLYPVTNFLSNKLFVEDKFSHPIVLAIFSGPGDISFNNNGFEYRALNYINYLSKNSIEKIILLSGKKKIISDTVTVKNLFIKNKFDEKKVFNLGDSFESSYQAMNALYNFATKNNIKKIVYSTEPLNSRRSKMIWKKNFSDIDFTFENVNSKINVISFPAQLKKTFITFYEYFSICYNFIKGII